MGQKGRAGGWDRRVEQVGGVVGGAEGICNVCTVPESRIASGKIERTSSPLGRGDT